MISVDSFGWIERLTGGPLAADYNKIMEGVDPMEIVTSVVSVYEVYRKLRPAMGEAHALAAVASLKSTRIAPVDERIALEAADYSLGLKLHFSDALIYATARRFDAVLHTSDPDLREVPHVAYHPR